jgi:hypothetical protein
VHRLVIVLNWLLLIAFVIFFGLELGGLAPKLDLDLLD